MRPLRALATFAIAAIALAGCTTASVAEPDPAENAGSWTVLAYEIADTNLEPDMMTDVGEMGSVGTQENLNIVALVDRAEGYTDEAVLGIDDWTGAKLLQIDDGSAEVLSDEGDINTGDPAVLSAFITQGITDYPADHYSLIISDHGASWPGVGGDESTDYDSLSLAEIHQGIADGLSGAGLDKLDLLGFDACLMATYEVASDLAPLANRMIASQELEPGHGWDYSALQYIVENGGATTDDLGKAIIDGFETQAIDQETDSEITLSLIDLTAMDDVDAALSEFTGQLVAAADTTSPAVGTSLAAALGFGKSPDPAQDSFMTDLAILAGDIGVDALNVSDAADAVIRSVNDAVLDTVAGQATKGATGLSIYFPPQSDYFNADYDALGNAGGWADFLASYYATGASIPADEQPSFEADDATVEFDDDGGVYVSGIFDLAAQDNLATATLRYGRVEDDGSVTLIGDADGQIVEDGSGQALGFWDFSKLVISDDSDSTIAYLSLDTNDDTGGLSVNVPLSYYGPGDVGGDTYQDALLSLTLDDDTDEDFSETYYAYNPELGTYGELTAEASGLLVPQVLALAADGSEEWLETSTPGIYADLPSLLYELDDLESGTLVYVELTVADFGGNSDSVSATLQVP